MNAWWRLGWVTARRQTTPSQPRRAAVAACVLATVTGCTGAPAAPSTSGPPTTGPTPATAAPATTAPVVDPLVGRLRAGGLILYFRHAVTDQSRQDDPSPDLADRSTQRNLSDVGRRQATAIGEAIRTLAIPIGPVLASPYARARETGELAFGAGRVSSTRDLLNEAYPGTDDADLAQRLRRLLGEQPPSGQNTVLIGHGFNITEATGITIAEGECAVFEPAAGGGFRLVARVLSDRWSALARVS